MVFLCPLMDRVGVVKIGMFGYLRLVFVATGSDELVKLRFRLRLNGHQVVERFHILVVGPAYHDDRYILRAQLL